jgi:tetratricopeptide (TPR) repeat protein
MSPTGTALILLISSIQAITCLAQSPPPLSPDTTRPIVLPLPSPPDMPLPDPVGFPRHDDKKQSPATRMINRVTPVCLDVFFHTCLYWRNDNAPPVPDADREFAKNFEVGNIYYYEKNHRASESRFREALQYKPDQPEATYKLAVSLEKLGRTGEAIELYQSYLKLAPSGAYADWARKRLAK